MRTFQILWLLLIGSSTTGFAQEPAQECEDVPEEYQLYTDEYGCLPNWPYMCVVPDYYPECGPDEYVGCAPMNPDAPGDVFAELECMPNKDCDECFGAGSATAVEFETVFAEIVELGSGGKKRGMSGKIKKGSRTRRLKGGAYYKILRNNKNEIRLDLWFEVDTIWTTNPKTLTFKIYKDGGKDAIQYIPGKNLDGNARFNVWAKISRNKNKIKLQAADGHPNLPHPVLMTVAGNTLQIHIHGKTVIADFNLKLR